MRTTQLKCDETLDELALVLAQELLM